MANNNDEKLIDAAYLADIRADYGRCLRYTISDDEAVKLFFEEHEADMSGNKYNYLILALAQAMHRYGRLNMNFRMKADDAADQITRSVSGGMFDKMKRKKAVAAFMKTLDGPMPEPRPIEYAMPFENHWQTGDAIAFKYRGKCRIVRQKYGEEKFYEGGYVILIFEKMVGRYVTGFVKLWNENYEPDEKHGESKNMPFVKHRIVIAEGGSDPDVRYDFARFAVLIEGQDQAEKTKYLGNIENMEFPNCGNNNDYIRVNFENFSETAVHEYFLGNLKSFEVTEVI